MLEQSILKGMLSKDNYYKFRSFVSKEALVFEAQTLLEVIDGLHTKKDGDLSVLDVSNELYSTNLGVDPKKFDPILNSIESNADTEGFKGVLEAFKTRRTLEDISLVALDALNGSKSILDVLAEAEKLKTSETEDDFEFVTDDLDEILQDTVKAEGLRWRSNTLNKALGSLRLGDFGFIFARPETGKTSFLASEVSFMAQQCHERGLGPVVWFNNEESDKKVKLRVYQATLAARLDQLLRDPSRAKDAYQKLIGTSLRLMTDKGDNHRLYLEKVIRATKPSLIVIDQLDKIEGFKADREDLILGEKYKWARKIAKTYAPVIGVSQADATAEGVQWLEMAHIANSKTAKSAEADWILGIGKKLDPGYERIRYLHPSKNKLVGDMDSDEFMRHGRLELEFKPEIARYADL